MKKILSLLLVISLIFSSNGITSYAEDDNPFSDIEGHWGEQVIKENFDKGFLSGYPDGTFKPDQDLTNSELIALVNRFLGFEKQSLENYQDVKGGEWFSPDTAKAKYYGYILDLEARPYEKAKREDFVRMLDLILDATEDNLVNEDLDFSDVDTDDEMGAKIKQFSLVGYINGYPDGTFKPTQSISRVEVLTLFNNTLGYVVTSQEDVDNIPDNATKVTIINKDIELDNMVISGDLYISAGVNGDVVIKNTTIQGQIKVSSENEETSVKVVDSKVEKIVLTKGVIDPVVEIVSSNVGEIKTKTSSTVILKEDSEVENLTTTSKTVLVQEKESIIGELNVEAETSVTGDGTIKKAIISVENVSIEKDPVYVEVADDVDGAEIAGNKVTSKNDDLRPPSGGSSGSSGGSAAPSSNAKLSQLSISDVTFDSEFTSTTYNYTAVVGDAVSSVSISHTPIESSSKVRINNNLVDNNALTDINLQLGENTITILVTAPDGSTTATYSFVITKLPDVSFSNVSLDSINESDNITIEAELTEAYTSDVIIELSATDSSTASSDEYSLSSNTLTITAGDTSGTITLSLVDDNIDEVNETIVLDMESVSNANESSDNTMTINILDDDNEPVVEFEHSSSSSIDESTSVDISVNLSTVSGKEVRIPILVDNSTDADSSEYSLAENELTINAGETSATLTINLVDDSIVEGDEHLILNLGTLVNASSGVKNSHDLTITDDDGPAVVTKVTSSIPDGTYGLGAQIDIEVMFNKAVNVVGTPILKLETGATDAEVDYSSGTGTNTLVFSYIVSANETSLDLDYISSDSLTLNGGTIKDDNTNDATLDLPAPGDANSLGGGKAIALDTNIPSGYTVSINQSVINNTNDTSLSFTFADGESGATYNYSIDDTNGGTAAVTGTGTLSTATDTISGIDVSSLDDDTLTLTVYLTDTTNNQGSDTTDTVIKETVAPSGYTVSIDQANIGSGNETAMSFTFTNGESGATCNYSVDDSNGGTAAITGTGTLLTATDTISGINVSSLDDDTLTLTVYLSDANGNQGADTTDTVSKDANAPSGYTVSVDQSAIIDSNATALSFTFTSGESGAEYNYSIDDTNGATAAVTGSGTLSTATDTISGIDVSSLDDDTLTLTVYLTDSSSNQGSDTTDTVLKDTVSPSGYTVSIDQSVINNTNETSLSFTFADGESGATYNYSIDDTNGGTAAVTGTGTLSTATDTINGIDVSSLDDDTLTLTVYLTDTANNQGSDTTDTVVKETVAPSGYTISIDQANIGSGNETAMSFTFTDGESGATYNYSVDDSNGGTGAVTGTGTLLTATDTISGINVSSLDDDTLTLTVYLSDANGNQGADTTDTITKDTTAPVFVTVDDGGGDNTYTSGEMITFDIDLNETGLTVQADLSVINSSFSNSVSLSDDGDGTYSFTSLDVDTDGNMQEGANIAITFSAEDSMGNSSNDNGLNLKLDKTSPTVGNSGTISEVSSDAASISISWTKATDNVSNQSDLEYLVYYSLSDNIDSVSDMESNGQAVGVYTKDIDALTIESLNESATYYVNLIVVDELGYKTAYQTTEISTLASGPAPINLYENGVLIETLSYDANMQATYDVPSDDGSGYAKAGSYYYVSYAGGWWCIFYKEPADAAGFRGYNATGSFEDGPVGLVYTIVNGGPWTVE